MTLTQIGQLLTHIAVQLATYLSPISVILKLVGITTKEHTPYLVENEVLAIGENLSSGTYGLAVIAAGISALQTSVDSLGSPQQATSPVILPATTPAGAWPTDAGAASSVWGTAAEFSPPTMYDLVNNMGRAILAVAEAGNWGPYSSPYFSTVGWDETTGPDASSLTFPAPSADAILSTDTLTTWLTRELPTWTVAPGYWGSDAIAVYGDPGSGPLIHTCTLDDRTFSILQATLFPATLDVAPVFPGIAKVTLGTPVPIDATFTVPGPMDGVLVTLTSVPSKQGQFAFGATVSYRNVGAISFVDDNGDSEYPQTLGFAQAVYCPKAMLQAASLVGRASAGVTGTVTPWVAT